MKKIALVVPTIREDSFREFVSRWDEIGLFEHVDLIVMEDNPTCTFPVTVQTHHFSWATIEADLKEKSWIIPRRSDTVRSYAYYKAWKLGYEFILTLDDDCYPCTPAEGIKYDGEGFVKNHMEQLTGRTRWHNTLNAVKPRGVPFYNIGKNMFVILNHGLWGNVLDYDAPYQLANPIPEKWTFDNKIVPNGMYFPMCGMNVMWKAEATPLMYHLLMGQVVGHPDSLHKVEHVNGVAQLMLEKLPFDRFGDIWAGLFMKKIVDICCLQVSTGMPYIRHERASNPFTNLRKEANGIEVNEKIWEFVDAWIPTESTTWSAVALSPARRLAHLYMDLGNYVTLYDDFPEHKRYFEKLGYAMMIWADMFIKEPNEDEIPF